MLGHFFSYGQQLWVIYLNLDWCCICKNSGETVEYFLLHCSVARDFWSLVFALSRIFWVMFKCWLVGKEGSKSQECKSYLFYQVHGEKGIAGPLIA